MAFKQIESIEIKNAPSNILEKIFFGKFEIFGYGSKLSGFNRLGAALTQTLWSVFGLWLVYRGLVNSEFVLETQFGDEATVGLLAIIAGILGATFYNERTNIHTKWSYLAGLFNTALGLPVHNSEKCPSPLREHVVSCLAHDILIMEMWAHKSFRALFKDVIEKSVLFQFNGDIHLAHKKLNLIAQSGIDYDYAEELIGNYITHLLPPSDRQDFTIKLSKSSGNVLPW